MYLVSLHFVCGLCIKVLMLKVRLFVFGLCLYVTPDIGLYFLEDFNQKYVFLRMCLFYIQLKTTNNFQRSIKQKDKGTLLTNSFIVNNVADLQGSNMFLLYLHP